MGALSAPAAQRRWSVESSSPGETRAIGRALGRLLTAGQCVLLIGDLGAGKTTFAAGVGEGLETAERPRSPTYLLCAEHAGRHPLLHLDAYFTERMEALLLEGLAERFDADTVLVVEWGDRLASWWPEERIELRLRGEGERRGLEFTGRGREAAATVASLAACRQDISRDAS